MEDLVEKLKMESILTDEEFIALLKPRIPLPGPSCLGLPKRP